MCFFEHILSTKRVEVANAIKSLFDSLQKNFTYMQERKHE